MDKYWKSVIALTGLGGVGAFVFWSLNKGWLELGIFSKLTDVQTFRIMCIFLVLVFLGLVVLVYAYLKSNGAVAEREEYKPKLPKPIAEYIEEFPEFLRKADIDTLCVRTSRESFFSAVRKILSFLDHGSQVVSTDSLSFTRSYISYWFTEGLGYLELNYEAAKRGIDISRIFVTTRSEYEKHKEVLDMIGKLQAMSGVKPYVAFYDNLPDECKREFVIFDKLFVDEVIYDFRSEKVIDNYISWSPEKLNQFRGKIDLIQSHIFLSWQINENLAVNFNSVRQYASNILESVLINYDRTR